MKRTNKKLRLRRDVVRVLSESDMALVDGGRFTVTLNCMSKDTRCTIALADDGGCCS
jgi:hypothetical protein